MVTLETKGRRTGKTLRVPMVVAELNGNRYLVPMLGEKSDWLLNARVANGEAAINHGIKEKVRLEEVTVSERAPILTPPSSPLIFGHLGESIEIRTCTRGKLVAAMRPRAVRRSSAMVPCGGRNPQSVFLRIRVRSAWNRARIVARTARIPTARSAI